MSASITKNLYLDVTSLLNKLFDKHTVITEVVCAKPLYAIESFRQFITRKATLHAYATTTSGTFQHHWITNLFCRDKCLLFVAEKLRPGKQRNLRLCCNTAS